MSDWISVSSGHKPERKMPVLVAVSFIRYIEQEDGAPGEFFGQLVTEGEYTPQKGDVPGYFESYSSPHGDNDWITHWMPLPEPPK